MDEKVPVVKLDVAINETDRGPLKGDAVVGCLYSDEEDRISCFGGGEMDADSISLLLNAQILSFRKLFEDCGLNSDEARALILNIVLISLTQEDRYVDLIDSSEARASIEELAKSLDIQI